MPTDTSVEPTPAEIQELRRALAEAQDALSAIRAGEVDAVVVRRPDGRRLYTLEAAYEPYRVFVEHMQQGAAATAADGLILFVNDAFATIVGRRADTLIGTSFAALVDDDRRPEVDALLAGGEGGREMALTLSRAADGRRSAVLFVTTLPDGTRCLVLTDVTERQRLEDARRQAEDAERAAHERLRQFIESNIIGVVVADGAGRILEANDYYLRLIGHTRADLERGQLDWWAHTPSEWLTADRRAIAAVQRTGSCAPYEKEYVRHDGTRVAVLLADARLPGPDERIAAFALDITDRKRIESERARLAAIVASSPDAIIAEDLDGTIRSWNAGAEQLYGYSPAEAVGRPLAMLAPPDRAAEITEVFERIKRGETIVDHDTTRVRRDGSRVEVSVTLSPIREADGEVSGVSAIARDVSALKRAERELIRLNAELESRVRARTEELETANRELEAFTYSVSHDLRTPLRALQGYSRILLEEEAAHLSAEGQRFLRVISDNSLQMGRLIDDLLDFSRLGRRALETCEVDAEKLFGDAFRSLEDGAGGRTVEFRIGALPSCKGDASLLRQVAINLLANALKFTRRRAIARIEVKEMPSLARDGEVVYAVEDNGVGFEMQYVDRLFGVFQRLHSAAEYEGTGVGLATVQRIVTRHGGRVWAEGVVDRGATFYVALPRSQP